MPELPEVERARKLIQETCRGYKIKSVDSAEDKIVYTGGADHAEFAKEITGRTITGAERKGKTFWMTLSGKGRLPVMHFGMTGMLQLKGEEPTWYRRKPRESVKTWPPRFYKFVLKLEPQNGSVGDEPIELAFLDGRRLGRLRLLPSPVEDHPPVSALGFDPVLSHPTFEEFQKLIAKKKGTVKGMIMDQAFSAGVGNWVADEVLYQARIHPSCPVPHLSEQNIKDLHFQLRAVPLKAVEVNADSRQFPEDWLFRWRWGKGEKQRKGSDKAVKKAQKKKGAGKVEQDVDADVEEEGMENVKPSGKSFLALPDGRPATIEFIEVGGRTTAVVSELQKMPEGVEIKPKISKGGKGSQSKKRAKSEDSGDSGSGPGSGGSSLSSDREEVTTPVKATTSRQRAAAAKMKVKTDPVESVKEELDTPTRKVRKLSAATDAPSTSKSIDRRSGNGKDSVVSPTKSKGRAKGNTKSSALGKVDRGTKGKRESREVGDGPKPSTRRGRTGRTTMAGSDGPFTDSDLSDLPSD